MTPVQDTDAPTHRDKPEIFARARFLDGYLLSAGRWRIGGRRISVYSYVPYITKATELTHASFAPSRRKITRKFRATRNFGLRFRTPKHHTTSKFRDNAARLALRSLGRRAPATAHQAAMLRLTRPQQSRNYRRKYRPMPSAGGRLALGGSPPGLRRRPDHPRSTPVRATPSPDIAEKLGRKSVGVRGRPRSYQWGAGGEVRHAGILVLRGGKVPASRRLNLVQS
jgi:hypothetical protein